MGGKCRAIRPITGWILKVAKVVSLGQIIEMDSTVINIADLSLGSYATRTNKNGDWKIYKNIENN